MSKRLDKELSDLHEEFKRGHSFIALIAVWYCLMWDAPVPDWAKREFIARMGDW